MTQQEKLKLLTNNGKYKTRVYNHDDLVAYYITDEEHDLEAEIIGERDYYFMINLDDYYSMEIDIDALNELINFVKSVKDVLKEETE